MRERERLLFDSMSDRLDGTIIEFGLVFLILGLSIVTAFSTLMFIGRRSFIPSIKICDRMSFILSMSLFLASLLVRLIKLLFHLADFLKEFCYPRFFASGLALIELDAFVRAVSAS